MRQAPFQTCTAHHNLLQVFANHDFLSICSCNCWSCRSLIRRQDLSVAFKLLWIPSCFLFWENNPHYPIITCYPTPIPASPVVTPPPSYPIVSCYHFPPIISDYPLHLLLSLYLHPPPPKSYVVAPHPYLHPTLNETWVSTCMWCCVHVSRTT